MQWILNAISLYVTYYCVTTGLQMKREKNGGASFIFFFLAPFVLVSPILYFVLK